MDSAGPRTWRTAGRRVGWSGPTALTGLGGSGRSGEQAGPPAGSRRGRRRPCRRWRTARRRPRRGARSCWSTMPPSSALVTSGPWSRTCSSISAATTSRCSGRRGGSWPPPACPPPAWPCRTARPTPTACARASGASSARSKVVNRRPHARHSRRRRMASPSSAMRESTTLSSRLAQAGHLTLRRYPGRATQRAGRHGRLPDRPELVGGPGQARRVRPGAAGGSARRRPAWRHRARRRGGRRPAAGRPRARPGGRCSRTCRPAARRRPGRRRRGAGARGR